MTSISPAEGTRPLSRPTLRQTAAGTLHHVAGRISLVARLSMIVKEMIMAAVVVVAVVGLILYLLSVPPYYELRLTREAGAGPVGNHAAQDHQVPVKSKVNLGLKYSPNGRLQHWGPNFAAVSHLSIIRYCFCIFCN